MFKTFFIVLHFVLIGFIILFVLLHQGKGAEAGMSFRNNKTSHIIFGSRGSDDFFFKIILFFFILFLITTIMLTKTTTVQKEITTVELSNDSVGALNNSEDKNLEIIGTDKKLPKISV